MTNDLALPAYYLITPEPASGTEADLDTFLARLTAALEAGHTLVQLRVKTLDVAAYAALAAATISRCHAHGARVILNGPIDFTTARTLNADGVHLNSARLCEAAPQPCPSGLLLSAACHTLEELLLAERAGADFATLSPVLPTLSHPGAPTLGWMRFADYARQTSLPLYALGGMTRAHLPLARRHGAHGIAGIRGLG